MAAYNEDFSGGTPGSLPSGWTKRWDTTAAWTAESGGDDQILKCTLSATKVTLCTMDSVDSDADRDDTEVLAKILVKAVSVGAQNGGVAVRGSGGSSTKYGYSALIYGNDLSVHKYVNNTGTYISTQGLTLTANTWYWLRFRVNGTSLRARIWADGESEPGTWNIDTTDSSISAAGWVGARAADSAADPEYDLIAIATNGDTASVTSGTTGTLSASESGSDTASISGDVLVKGALAATESGADSAALAGKVLVEGALSASESGADTAALAGDVLVKGALAASESGNDSASFIGEGFVPTATGTLAASESGSDTASIAGKVYIAGTLSAVEGGLDGFAASGNILVQGAIAASETGDDTAAFLQEILTLTPADLDAIAAAVWADPVAVAAHAKLDEIITRITC